MATIRDGLSWSGSGATLSLFVITESEEPPALNLQESCKPERVRTYPLEDSSGILGGRYVFEYDAEFREVPEKLGEYLESCMRSAMENGAQAAWFGFEGSFDFEFLFAPEVASQIYALADREDMAVASNADLVSNDWRERVSALRERVLGDVHHS